MSTIITKGLRFSVPTFGLFDVVATSKRHMDRLVKAACQDAGLDTAQDAVKALKTLNAKIKAAGLVWQDQTAKKATKRASRASGRRYEHHARNELMKNLEKSSGAPRGGEAIEIALAKDLKGETRKAAKARRKAAKVKPYVEAALTAKFKAGVQDSEQIAVLEEVTKTSHVETHLCDAVEEYYLLGRNTKVFATLILALVNGNTVTIQSCEDHEIKSLCIEAEAAITAEEAKVRREAELEAACEAARAKAELESAAIVAAAQEEKRLNEEAEFRTLFEALLREEAAEEAALLAQLEAEASC